MIITLKERYAKKDLATLVRVLENKSEYTEECVQVVLEEVERRNPNQDELKEISKGRYHRYYKAFFEAFDPYGGVITFYPSHFLSMDEVKEIVREEFDLWIKRHDSFDFDVWAHAIGD